MQLLKSSIEVVRLLDHDFSIFNYRSVFDSVFNSKWWDRGTYEVCLYIGSIHNKRPKILSMYVLCYGEATITMYSWHHCKSQDRFSYSLWAASQASYCICKLASLQLETLENIRCSDLNRRKFVKGVNNGQKCLFPNHWGPINTDGTIGLTL